MTSNTSKGGDDPLLGRTVAGRYRIDQRIARGGMGVVYLGEHLRLQRPIVFKVLSEHLVDDEKASARFEQEALGLSRLSHPNIVTVFDFGVEDGITYIAMEFVPGITLSQLLRAEGVMSFGKLLPLAVQIVEAIGAAHEKDIVHRDIKPANIMVVREDGRPDLVKVLDFGLARLTSSSLDITKDNLVGTVSYVAPEVVKGSRAGKAADVYALGVMFYFMLTGRKPFKAEDDLSVLYKHVHDAPQQMQELLPAEHDVPSDFIALIHRCLAKEPRDRPADGTELLAALSEVVSLPSLPRMPSGEFLSIQRAAAADRIPELEVVPVSVELSSMALRERPNSRWGVPLIAICVFAAGAVALLLMADAGGEAEPAEVVSPAEETVAADEAAAGALEDTADDAGIATDAAIANSHDEPMDESAAAKDRRLKNEPKLKPPSSGGNKPHTVRDTRPKKTTAAAEKSDSADSNDDAEPLPIDNGSPALLDVDESSDNILLPVD